MAVRVPLALGVCAAAAVALAGCSTHAPSSHDLPTATRSASLPAPQATMQTAEPRPAQLSGAVTRNPLADKVMGRAWNGDVMQVSVRSDRSTVHDQMRLCTELASEFGDGYGVKQIFVTVVPVETSDSVATGAPFPVVSWNAKSRTCARESA